LQKQKYLGLEKLNITAIIPTFNEEAKVEKALKSLDFAKELIIVDSFSTDRTLDIAKSHGATIIQHEYLNSAAQKNWIIPQAKYDWIVLLDADEWFSDELKQEIIKTVKEGPKYDCYWMYRANHFMGKRMKYTGLQGDKVIRLFRKDCRYENKHVHAEVITEGKTVTFFKGKIMHNTYNTLDSHIVKLNRYADWQAKDLENKIGRIKVYHLFIKPSFRFFKHYILQRGFLDGIPGFTYSILQSYAVGLRYLKIWLNRRNMR